MILEKHELAQINGGGLSATLFNSIARISKTIYDIGYEFGSTMRRLFSGKICKA